MPVGSLERQEEAVDNKKNYLVRNYVLNTADGALFNMAMGMVPLNTVLTYFISGYVSQKWLIGLLSFINILLMFSPQILVSKKLERLKHYKPFLLATGLGLRLMWLLLGLDVILLADRNPVLFIILFYVIYSLIGLFSAFTSITWLNFIVKIIPNEYRGRFLGIRFTICGIFESLGALIMGIIIKRFDYPTNYGVLFITVFVLTLLSLWILSFSKEHESRKESLREEERSYIQKMASVLRKDKNFTIYLVTVALIGSFGKMAFAFQIVFAKEFLGIEEQQVSYATFILLASQSVGYLIWGILADKHGMKLTLELSALIFIPAIILTYLMSNIFVFFVSLVLFGIAQSARNSNENNFAINLCREEGKQPMYIGLRNLLMGPIFALNPVFAGLIYDFFGYNALFIISAVCMAAGLIIMTKFVTEHR
ncbi:MAG TPA: MFS transporter [Candidatus Nitrosocosmicus sp.]|nr:MFS transporter [Candidatus Nitrosocosmicus sp.]